MTHFWLLKSEPTTFSITDLQKAPRSSTSWEGVRNYQARNYLRAMRMGDQAFFYHSSCAHPAIVGIVTLTRESYPDPTAFDPHSPYYDPVSVSEKPRWFQVDVTLQTAFQEPIPLALLKKQPALQGCPLLQKGSRLSVLPLTENEWYATLALTDRAL